MRNELHSCLNSVVRCIYFIGNIKKIMGYVVGTLYSSIRANIETKVLETILHLMDGEIKKSGEKMTMKPLCS